MATPQLDFKNIKERASFEAVLAHYGVVHKGYGAEHMALCPFHDDTRPSLSINLDLLVYHCFACKASGDILTFVAEMERCSVLDAALQVATWSKVTPSTSLASEASVANRFEREELVKVGNKPLSFALTLDPTHHYLVQRGLSPATISTFGLGYCSHGIMEGRIAIPIHDEHGNLIAYAGRWPSNDVPPDVPRYLLPRGFSKSAVLFNLHRVIGKERLTLVEGYWSVFRLHQFSIPAVALMGTNLSEAQEDLLVTSAVRSVILFLDGDIAGREATGRIEAQLDRYMDVSIFHLPDGEQPTRIPEHALFAMYEAL